jgi:hypothetical protein
MGRKKGYIVVILLVSLGLCSNGVLGEETIDPAFSSSIHTSSSVSNVENAAIESSLRSSLIGEDGSVPGVVKYTFSMSAANKSAPGGAVGSARTEFVVTSLEGRNSETNASSERVWRDRTEVTGTIVNLLKNFDYTSGIRI